jgi:putative Mg2+ transporter-C (MgtC) family protein
MIVWWETPARVVLAALLGALIGWDREDQGKPAGLRTTMLVSLSACVFVASSQGAARELGVPLEPVRAMAAIAQGVGFLGAGVVLQSRGQVLWLTTAAAVWAAAAIGVAAALGQYLLAVAGAGLVLVTLRGLIVVEDRWILPRRTNRYGREREMD